MSLAKRFLAFLGWCLGIGPLLRVFYEPRELALAYHTIGDSRQKYAHINTSLDAFKNHINYLKKRGYSFHRFSDTLKPGAEKRVYLYFDDGFRTVLEQVVPYLRKERIPATLFVTTDYIDDKNADEYLRWEEVKSMTDIFEIGSHSKRHIKLNKVSLEKAREEMKNSKDIIERNLGVSVTSFSYPKGRSSRELEALAHELGYVVTTADKRFCKARSDQGDSMAIFYWKTVGLWS